MNKILESLKIKTINLIILISLGCIINAAAINITKVKPFPPIAAIGIDKFVSAVFAIKNDTTVPLKVLPSYFYQLPLQSKVTVASNCDQPTGFGPGQTCLATITVGPLSIQQIIDHVGPIIRFPNNATYQPGLVSDRINLHVF